MALITLRRNLCHLPDFRIHGAVAALKNQPVNHVHKAAKAHLCPLLFSQQSSPFRVRFHHSCCKKFHSENGNDLHPVGEPMFSQVHDWDRQGENTENVDEERFYRRLSSFTSSAEVLGFISTLATLPDAVAARALQWICEMEKKDGNSRLPKEILENNIFKALCFRFEQEPSRLSNTDIVTALQALSLLHVDPQSGLLVSLVAECQSRLRKGGLEVHNLCILGESLIKLQGPGCTTLEVILCQLQGENLEKFTPEDIVALYRMFQACPGKVEQLQTFLNQVNNYSLSVVSNLSPKLISQMLNALVALDQTRALPLIIKLGKYAVRHIPNFTNEELKKVLEAFIYFGHTDRFFTKALEQHVSALCPSLNPEIVSKIMEYCSRRLILSKPILDAAAEIFVCQSEKFSPSQISELIEPFGKLNYLPPNASALFRKLENTLFTDFNHFPPKILLKLLHSCLLIERHPVNFMAKIFSPYFLQQLQDVEIKLDEEGFVLPLTVNEDVHKRIALCIDGPKRFCFNSKNLLGKEAVKQRHLRLLGYQVVQIPYHEVEMLKSRPELVEYLQRKLFSQNDEVQR
ncbi:FAST kinase domain-containing protein 3, mitochondrial isoform X2 [Choloepus didactylus]|uniref:FAST kinase domain-containing protein 3, mitochondrial isoform X2 n=1 Tax=Choloepus didactylus TaxID=27675 RepID=UPI0018A00807|nr:FAST kinase domain-containing protein 3, mitochondrial isoform X2 [Choloepus didactylus]